MKNLSFEEKIKKAITDKAFDRCSGCQEEAIKEIQTAINEEIENRLRNIGIGIVNCKKCGKNIIFIKTKMGNLMPTNLNLISHFADCPNAKEFRKK